MRCLPSAKWRREEEEEDQSGRTDGRRLVYLGNMQGIGYIVIIQVWLLLTKFSPPWLCVCMPYSTKKKKDADALPSRIWLTSILGVSTWSTSFLCLRRAYFRDKKELTGKVF